MGSLLDIRSLAAASAFVCLALALGMLAVRATRRTYPGFGLWVAAACSGAVATALLALQGRFAPWITVVVPNLFVGLYSALNAAGLERFLARRPSWAAYAVLLAVDLAASLVFTYTAPSVTLRMVVVTLVMGLLACWCAVLVAREAPRVLGRANHLVTAAFGALAAWSFVRVAVLLPGSDAANALAANRTGQAVLFALFPGITALVAFALTALDLQRVEHDLQAAADEVRLLRGVIPICAGCKRVHEAQGWTPLDQYVRARSEAEFSHGLCPDCAARLYPGVS